MGILIIADTDLDGTGSAVLITKYYEMFHGSKIPFAKGTAVTAMFPTRARLDELFSDAEWCRRMYEQYEHIFLCDTAPDSHVACKNIGTILAPKMTVYDHHATNLKRLEPYKRNFKDVNFGALKIVEGERCSARVTFDTLRGGLHTTPANKYGVYHKFSALINDYDLGYFNFPRSMELADYVTAVGPDAAYPVLLKIADAPNNNVGDMGDVLGSIMKEKEASLSLAKDTLVKHKGYKTPFYTCMIDDWPTWVSVQVVPKTGLIAMFDIKRRTISFRVGAKYGGIKWHTAKGTKPNALDFAEALGGGGHPQAAGVSGGATPVFKHLSKRFGEILLEIYDERSRNSTNGRNRRTNSVSRKPRAKRP